MTALNTAVADAMDSMVVWIDAAGGGEEAVSAAIKRALVESSPVRFEGDNYSDEWVAEAERRGLLNLRKTPEAIEQMRSEETIALFDRQAVLSADEVESRYNVAIEQYVTIVEIEVDTLREMVNNLVIPAAVADRSEAASALEVLLALKDRGLDVDTSVESSRFQDLSVGLAALSKAQRELKIAIDSCHGASDHAAMLAAKVVPAIEVVRGAVDFLEVHVADGLWPLPKYREILFMQE
jgi:glutamine synthetase